MSHFYTWIRSVCYCSIVAVVSAPAVAQDDRRLLRERSPDQRPALLVLGSGHFDNPGLDVANIKVDDVLAPTRQAEINKVVEQLAAYRPTHIAVEWPMSKQAALDARYRDYRDGKYQLGRGEEEQLGLKLAAKLHLARVYAADWNEDSPGTDADYDWIAYGQAHGQKAQVTALLDPKGVIGIVPLGTQSIGTWLLQLNRPEILAANHRNYFDCAAIGDAEHQPGANWVGQWYARNLRIFTNLVRAAGRPEDRMLVVYGQGHAYLLRQFAVESGAFRVVDVGDVLSP
ncbi:MAG TPA: DUF5694 domain-containing protein [Gemmatimonadaceae bacterium]|nr:DUF5694 domain-containing protein [Gemmatimonadaceae bacterium]